MRFVYPFEIEDDGESLCISFPDVPEALTSSRKSEKDMFYMAHDCLVTALRSRIADREKLPKPSPVANRPAVVFDALESAKLALAQAMLEEGATNVALAKRLGVTEAVVRRLLDLDHRSHIGQVEKALAELGRRLEIRVKAA